MTLMDVLPQLEKLDHTELVELHSTIGSWLSEQKRSVGQDEVGLVEERYRDFLLHPDEISEDEMMDYLNDLVG